VGANGGRMSADVFIATTTTTTNDELESERQEEQQHQEVTKVTVSCGRRDDLEACVDEYVATGVSVEEQDEQLWEKEMTATEARQKVEEELERERRHLEELQNLNKSLRALSLSAPSSSQRPKAALQYEEMVYGRGDSRSPAMLAPSPPFVVQEQQRRMSEQLLINELQAMDEQKMMETATAPIEAMAATPPPPPPINENPIGPGNIIVSTYLPPPPIEVELMPSPPLTPALGPFPISAQ
jgi:hypothetical protein